MEKNRIESDRKTGEDLRVPEFPRFQGSGKEEKEEEQEELHQGQARFVRVKERSNPGI
jgi:hypothetical protein